MPRGLGLVNILEMPMIAAMAIWDLLDVRARVALCSASKAAGRALPCAMGPGDRAKCQFMSLVHRLFQHSESRQQHDLYLEALGLPLTQRAPLLVPGSHASLCACRCRGRQPEISRTLQYAPPLVVPAADLAMAVYATFSLSPAQNSLRLTMFLNHLGSPCYLFVVRVSGSSHWTAQLRPCDRPAAPLLLAQLASFKAAYPAFFQDIRLNHLCPPFDSGQNLPLPPGLFSAVEYSRRFVM